MQLTYTIHNPAGSNVDRRVHRIGPPARELIRVAEQVIEGDLTPWIGRTNPTLGITIHKLSLED